ncbi:hypothetical protein MMA231_00983 [Asticcacaulis sp. MM231]|uniref:phage GP46 family protein n=1 Tax=Asticcacaulis sp. MM231 TaxID=3157666 RepID=UPI0032D57A30
MIDLALIWDRENLAGDIALDGVDLKTETGLYTAILLSLWTDRRANKDDILPDGSTDRRGWWGDEFAEIPGDRFGSRLWLLNRAKINPETLRLIRDYILEALAWLTRSGIASTVDATVSRLDTNTVGIKVTFTRPAGGAGTYDFVWDNLSGLQT